jgi:hypothetical protein
MHILASRLHMNDSLNHSSYHCTFTKHSQPITSASAAAWHVSSACPAPLLIPLQQPSSRTSLLATHARLNSPMHLSCLPSKLRMVPTSKGPTAAAATAAAAPPTEAATLALTRAWSRGAASSYSMQCKCQSTRPVASGLYMNSRYVGILCMSCTAVTMREMCISTWLACSHPILHVAMQHRRRLAEAPSTTYPSFHSRGWPRDGNCMYQQGTTRQSKLTSKSSAGHSWCHRSPTRPAHWPRMMTTPQHALCAAMASTARTGQLTLSTAPGAFRAVISCRFSMLASARSLAACSCTFASCCAISCFS